jgi:hypothetical protein
MARSPLFDIYDPSGLLPQQAEMGMLPPDEDEYGLPVARRRPQLADLMPEEQRSGLLRSLANAGTSGLAGLGWILDTPGSLVRGTISGLAEGNPLKGVQTLLSPSDERVSGRDLLRQFNMVGDEDNWSNFGAGLATEVLTDPLTFLNPAAILGRGAYGAAGRAAQRASMLDDVKLLARRAGEARGRQMGTREFLMSTTPAELAEQLPGNAMGDFTTAARAKGLNPETLARQPMASLMEVRIPGMEAGIPLGTGPVARRIARGLDDFGEALTTNPYTAPFATRAVRAFDPTVMERLDRGDQWRAREAFAGARQGEREFREDLARQLLAAQNAGRAFNEPAIQNAIVDSIEAATPERMAELSPRSRLAIDLMESVPEWSVYRDFARDALEARQMRLADAGVQTPEAVGQTGLGFFPRQKARFARERIATPPGSIPPTASAYERGNRVYTLDDVVGRSRRPYLREMSREQMRRLMEGTEGAALRDRLFSAPPDDIPEIIDEAAGRMGVPLPYDRMQNADGQTIASLRNLLADPTLTGADRDAPMQALQELERQSRRMKQQLGELLRSSDRQFAETGRGLYDRHTVADLLRYGVGGARSEANANVVLDALERHASEIPAGEMPGGGSTNLLEAAAGLGMDPARVQNILSGRMFGADVANMSIPDRVIQELKAVAPRTAEDPTSLLGRAWDSYTNAFKVGALANPAYHSRNAYSGFLSSLTAGSMNPIDLLRSMYAGYQAGRGNYAGVVSRLRNRPGFDHLADPTAVVDEFLAGGARNPLGQGLVAEGESELSNAAQNLLIGQDPQPRVPWVGDGGLLYDPNRTWADWATVRGVDFAGIPSGREAPAQTLNPLLNLHERAGRRVEDALRIGTYIEGLRQGMTPDAAADLVMKTQVDYSPRAFTNFERKIKQWVPFYSYPRGIAPLVAENLLYRPGGLQGQVTRTVSSATRPSEDSFVPEDLRKTTAIPLPGQYGRDGNLERYLTKIDLPWRSLVDMVSPSFGNTGLETVSKTLQKTGMNLAGQLNPLIKAPLEMLLNRQLYSGRELSDLYSMLEQDIGPMGRVAEQIIVNAPGGSKLIGIARTARDERMSPAGRAGKIAFNLLSGLGVTDRDPEKSKSQAARAMLNEMLSTTPGVRTYENLTVPDEVLATMPEAQRRQYLLYKIMQSESSKRARERKKAEAALDPMQILGVTQ